MRWNPRHSEKKADRLEDLASALQAGIEPRTILTTSIGSRGLSGPIVTDQGFVAALQTRGLALDPVDEAVLSSAENAGELPAAMRERAAAARFEAEIVRDLHGRLRYPAFLLLATTLLVIWLWSQGFGTSGHVPLIGLVALVVVIIVVAAWLRHRIRHDSGFRGGGIPGLRSLLQDIGEVPYLIALRGLYAAGVLLPEANATASAASPVASVRNRLADATSRLRDGQGFAVTHAALGGLGDETLDLLTSGEKTGDLEDSIARAAERRRDVLARRMRKLSRVTGAVVYTIAALIVVYVVIDFYSQFLGRYRR